MEAKSLQHRGQMLYNQKPGRFTEEAAKEEKTAIQNALIENNRKNEDYKSRREILDGEIALFETQVHMSLEKFMEELAKQNNNEEQEITTALPKELLRSRSNSRTRSGERKVRTTEPHKVKKKSKN